MSPEQVAGYLDHALGTVEQAQTEAHLAECSSCRAELLEVARLRRAPPHWRRWYVTVPAAAAAAVLVLLAVRPGPPEPGPGTIRAGPSEGIPRFGTVAPVPDRPVPSDSILFVWHSAGVDANYRITVTDPTGSPVWTDATGDTTGLLPPGIRLTRDQAYFWYVDALLPNGQAATTGPREFRTAP